jgi:RNA polymerase-binding transcription factor DksA
MSTLTMSRPDETERRAQLEGRWRARLERVTELSLAYHDAAQLARQAGTAAERSRAGRRTRKLARAAAAERQALVEIEAALDRIARGQYGQCEQCREPISAALLASHPQARYCSSCGWLAVRSAGGGRDIPATGGAPVAVPGTPRPRPGAR